MAMLRSGGTPCMWVKGENEWMDEWIKPEKPMGKMRGVNMAYLWCMETCFEKRQHWEQGREVNPKPLRKCVLVAQSCLTFCDPMNCSLPGSSVHGIFQARILEWVAISFSRGSSQPRVQTWVSCIAGRFFTFWATREAL